MTDKHNYTVANSSYDLYAIWFHKNFENSFHYLLNIAEPKIYETLPWMP